LLCDIHHPYCDNVEEDQNLENVLPHTLSNHYQRDGYFSKERGILQEDKNNILFELMLKA
jgi:hypothetical protein